MTTYDFLKQPILGNRFFQYKTKHFFFENWLNAEILYVKDLDNENGVKPFNYFSNILTKKHNIYYKYLLIQNVLKIHKNQFDYSLVIYKNITNGLYFLFPGN